MNLSERYITAKRALFNKAYSDMNSKQREAIFTTEGPLLVLAGAGSGKTTVLVRRIAYIIKYGNAYNSEVVPVGITEDYVASLERAISLDPEQLQPILSEFIYQPAPPYNVLAISFTNKAANEIKNRLATEFSDSTTASDIWAGTFHSICMRILRRNADRLGYDNSFSIYDMKDSESAITSAMKSIGLDEKQFPVKDIQNTISRAKDRLLTPEEFSEEAGSDFRLSKIAGVYARYQQLLRNSNAMDFDDIIMQTVILLRDNADVKARWCNRFRYVCVDEYQDTNTAQFVLTSLLSEGSDNLMVVGDDDQSIYKFRGATIENILGFDRKYPDATILRLEQNYRSTGIILDAANTVISNNKDRKGKTLWTSGCNGEKITVYCAEDQNIEARYIAETVSRAVSGQGRHYKDFAVLYRTNAQSGGIERALVKSGIPYRMLAGTRFSDRREIRDIVAYMYLICNHSDRERLKRIINEPKRKIGNKTITAIEEIAAAEGKSLFNVIENADKYTALARSAQTLLIFASLINRLTAAAETESLPDLFDMIMNESGYKQMLIEGGMEELDRLENLSEFKSSIIEYTSNTDQPTLSGFLEETALVADVDKYDATADAVVLMTIHSAKGLEFPIVFLPGMEEGIFPGIRTICGNPSEMEEERRLAYVALTRAKEKIFIIHAKCRLLYGQTTFNKISRFAEEIPENLINEAAARNPAEAQAKIESSSGYASMKKREHTINEPITVGKPLFRRESTDSSDNMTIKDGDRVRHTTFGEGEVLTAKKMGADTLFEIAFDKVGTKKLMATYARLKKL